MILEGAICFLIVGSGVFFSSIFVSQIWYRYMLMTENKMNSEEFKLYIDKYDLSSIENDDENEVNDENYVEEETPEDGTIVMKYSKDEEGFLYWANNKNIHFQILKTVSRKYCLNFNTKHLYIDCYDDFMKQKKTYIEKMKKEEEDKKNKEEEEEKDCVFIIKKKKEKKKFKAVYNDNKFKRMGNLEECELINPKKEENENIKKISFDEFKKMMKEKTN